LEIQREEGLADKEEGLTDKEERPADEEEGATDEEEGPANKEVLIDQFADEEMPAGQLADKPIARK
jgi:hypothetical protein